MESDEPFRRHARPWVSFASALVVLVVSVLAFRGEGARTWGMGWLASGPIVTTLVAVHRAAMTRWWARTGRAPWWDTPATAIVLVGGLLVSASYAWLLALELS